MCSHYLNIGNQHLLIVNQQKIDDSCVCIIPTEKNDKVTEMRLRQSTNNRFHKVHQELLWT